MSAATQLAAIRFSKLSGHVVNRRPLSIVSLEPEMSALSAVDVAPSASENGGSLDQ